MSLFSMFVPNGPSGFGYSSTAEAVTEGLSLTGKNLLVTGVNSGLGQEAMRVFTLRGAQVLGTARTTDKAAAAAVGLTGVTPIACELADPGSVRAAVASVKALGVRLDAIVCNAGIMALPERQVAHGCELQFFTNHIGHFLLTTGLLDVLADDGRVVVLSSAAHNMAPSEGIRFDDLSAEKSYRPWTAYGQSKFANLLFAKELARRFSGTKKTANAVHPGVIKTNLGRSMNPVLQAASAVASILAYKNVPQGAATEVYAAVHPAAATITGKYLADCNVKASRADGDDPELARRLWEVSEAIAARV